MSISISGTCYTDEGVTPLLTGVTLNCSVNGAASSGSATSSVTDGTYTISGITAASGAVLTVYIQDAVNTEKAVIVTRSSGSNMTGIDLYQNDLVFSSGDGSNVTGANVNTSDGNGATGISAIYTASSNTILTVASGKNLYIASGCTYVTNAVSTLTLNGNFTIAGTFAPGTTNTISLFGNWKILSGTFTPNSNTVTLKGTGSQTITGGGQSFAALTVNSSGGTYTIQDDVTLTGNLTLTNGTLNGGGRNLTIAGNWAATSGIFAHGNGTVTFSKSSTSQIVNGVSGSFYTLTHSGAGTLQLATNTLTVTNTLINSGGTFDLNGIGLTATGATISNTSTIQLQGGEAIAGFSNDATHGTITYVGTGSTTYTGLVAGNTYNNLIFNGSGMTWKPTADMTVNGNLTITDGTFHLNGFSVIVTGNWLNSATFTHGNGTVTFNASTGTQTVTSGGSSLYNLTHSGVGTLQIATATVLTVANVLTNSSGVFDLNSASLTTTGATVSNTATIQANGNESITGFSNDATHGTVSYVGTANYVGSGLKLGNTYNNLTFNGLGGTWTPTGTVTVNGALIVSAGTLATAGQTITVTGLTSVSGGTMSSSSGTKTFNGGLTISSGIFTGSASTVDINGTLTLSGGILTAPSGAFTVSGDWARSGSPTFTPGTNTVTLDGTVQIISGSTSFYNLVSTNSGDVISFTDGTAQTITNAVTFQNVTLQGTSTGGWTVAMPVTQTIDHVTVSYSTATGNTAVAGAGSIDNGHNTNWLFSSPSFGQSFVIGYNNAPFPGFVIKP